MAKKSIKPISKEQEIKLAAQEIKFAKVLAGNDKKLRDKALKKLQKWLEVRSQSSMKFSQEDFMRLWKGLFYCMWMSDKLLPQEACAEMISKLIHSLKDIDLQLMFYKAHLQTMINEFYGIDQLRLNKFLMLVRRVLRQALTCIKNTRWKIDSIKQFGLILSETILSHDLSVKLPLGLLLHFIEIYLEEVAKIANNKLSTAETTELIRPFAKQMAVLKETRLLNHIRKHIFRYLMNQSDLGIEYHEKFKAWQQRGFPGGTIDALQKVEVSDDEEGGEWEVEDTTEKPKDPRAGKVDVELPQIQFDAKEIAKMLASYKFDKQSTTKTRKYISQIIEEYNKFSEGVFPLGLKKIKLPTEEDREETNVHNAAERLLALEDDLVDTKLTKAQKRKLKKENILFDEDDDDEKTENGIKIQEPPKKKKDKTSKLKLEKPTKPEKKLKLEKPTKPEKKLKLEKAKKPEKKKLEKANKPEKKLKLEKSTKPEKKLNLPAKPEKQSKLKKMSKVLKKLASDKTIIEKIKKKNIHFGLDDNGSVWEVTTDPPSPVKSPKKKQIFNESEWETPLKEGETEIFVPSNKFKEKLAKEAKKKGTTVSDLLTAVNTKILSNKKQGKPVATAAKPKRLNTSKPIGKTKKVRIMLSLNKAQNTRDYQKQVLSSPNIPYDAGKKPLKPLLKKRTLSSPINPFYKMNDSSRA